MCVGGKVCVQISVPGDNKKKAALLFLGVIMALTGDTSMERVLLPARLICPLALGPLPSALMGQPRWTCFWP